MSGISSIGGYNSDAYYRQLEQTFAEEEAAKAKSSAASALTAPVADASATADTATSSNSTSLKDKVRSAIMSAVHEAENSGGSGDMLSIILAAVEQTLKDAGIDPATAQDSDKVDASTKNLLTVLNKEAKVETQTMNILSALDNEATTAENASSPIDLLSQLASPAQSSAGLLGYLLDTQR
jgi:hypothetical protein